jgi:hypothetical protein
MLFNALKVYPKNLQNDQVKQDALVWLMSIGAFGSAAQLGQFQ